MRIRLVVVFTLIHALVVLPFLVIFYTGVAFFFVPSTDTFAPGAGTPRPAQVTLYRITNWMGAVLFCPGRPMTRLTSLRLQKRVEAHVGLSRSFRYSSAATYSLLICVSRQLITPIVIPAL